MCVGASARPACRHMHRHPAKLCAHPCRRARTAAARALHAHAQVRAPTRPHPELSALPLTEANLGAAKVVDAGLDQARMPLLTPTSVGLSPAAASVLTATVVSGGGTAAPAPMSSTEDVAAAMLGGTDVQTVEGGGDDAMAGVGGGEAAAAGSRDGMDDNPAGAAGGVPGDLTGIKRRAEEQGERAPAGMNEDDMPTVQ